MCSQGEIAGKKMGPVGGLRYQGGEDPVRSTMMRVGGGHTSLRLERRC